MRPKLAPQILPRIKPLSDSNEIKNNKKNIRYISSFFVCLLVGFFILFFSFPDHFNKYLIFLDKNIQEYKQHLFQIPRNGIEVFFQ